MPAKNRKSVAALLLAALLLAAGCADKDNITLPAVEGFYAYSGTHEKASRECEQYFRKYLKNAVKVRTPDVLEKAYQYTGQSAYSVRELRGIIRCSLLELAGTAKTMEEAKASLALLTPALDGMGADRAVSWGRLKDAADPGAFAGLLKTLTGDLAEICLKDIDSLRSPNPVAAEKRLTDLRFLVLALPENESEVVNITRIVWDELNADVNDVQLEKVRDLLKGAYPALVL